MEGGEIPKKVHRKIKLSWILLFLIALSLSANIFFILKTVDNGSSKEFFRLTNPLVSPNIDTNIQNSSIILHYNGLKTTLEGEIAEYNATGNVGIFIQDAKTGSWLGINERERFTPASLLKVPVMMAILKKVDAGEIRLDDKVTILEEDADPYYGQVYQEVGNQMKIIELLEQMVTYSDNTAKNALKRQLSQQEIDRVFVHVGIPDPYLEDTNQTVSPRNYIRLFKALYYSTFLTPASSEKALDLTTDTEQEQLISKEIPPEVQVAHKFGIIEGELLSDCGVVYHSKNPYFICIMVKNENLEKSTELIQELSKETYEFIDSSS